MPENTQELIKSLVTKAETVPLPETMRIRNIESFDGGDFFQILINCYSPQCESDGTRYLSVFSDVFAAVHDHLIDPDEVTRNGWFCQDSEVLPDYGQSIGPIYQGTRFWFQFRPRR